MPAMKSKSNASELKPTRKKRAPSEATPKATAALPNSHAKAKQSSQPDRGAKKLSKDTGKKTKKAQLISLLEGEDGASINELSDALGWLPHSTRAALTGLRKKGHVITKVKGEAGETRYRIEIANAKTAQ